MQMHYFTQVYMILKCHSEWKPHWTGLVEIISGKHTGLVEIFLSNHSGNRTYDLRNASPALYRLSYMVRTVHYCDISELGLVIQYLIALDVLYQDVNA